MLEKPFAIVSSIIKFNSRNFIWMTAAKSGEKFVFNTLRSLLWHRNFQHDKTRYFDEKWNPCLILCRVPTLQIDFIVWMKSKPNPWNTNLSGQLTESVLSIAPRRGICHCFSQSIFIGQRREDYDFVVVVQYFFTLLFQTVLSLSVPEWNNILTAFELMRFCL